MKTLDSDRDPRIHSHSGRSVATLLDEHAEVREVLAQLREAADLHILAGLLDRLVSLLETHFRREEASEGLLQMIGASGPGQAEGAAELVGEHRQILASARDLVARIRADESQPIGSVENALGGVLKQLEDHEKHETRLLRAVPADPNLARAASPTAGDPASRSTALEVNLRRTAIDVVIPEEQRVLLDITADRYGVQQNMRKLLRELNHSYIGWAEALEDLHRRAMGDFAHYALHERGAEAIEIFVALYAKAAQQASPAFLRETATRRPQSRVSKPFSGAIRRRWRSNPPA
jgi:hypothetical protein